MKKSNVNGNLAMAEAKTAKVDTTAVYEHKSAYMMMAETIVANAYKTDAGVMFASVPINMMYVEAAKGDKDGYQRRLDKAHVRDLAAHWDDAECGIIILAYRSGRFYILDGQHRVEAAKMLGIERLYCLIHNGLNYNQSADRFARQGERTKKLTGGETIVAAAEADPNSPEAVVRRVCNKYGVIVNRRYPTERGSLGGARCACTIARISGEEMLCNIFSLIDDFGWHMQNKAYSNVVLDSLKNVINVYGYETTRAKLVKACFGHTPHEIIIKAQIDNLAAKGQIEALTAYLGTIIRT